MAEQVTALPPSASMLVPLRLLNSHYLVGDDYDGNRQLALFTPSTGGTALATTTSTPTFSSVASSRSFRLPDGWSVQKVLRADGTRYDKYYFEPETRLKFRSLRAVQRYVNGEPYTPRRRVTRLNYQAKDSSSRKMIISGGKMLMLDEEASKLCHLALMDPTPAIAPPFNLPDGWIVEEVPRRIGGCIDKYYYEPGTGRKFRSLASVRRHLEAWEETAPLSMQLAEIKENAPLSKMFKMRNNARNSGPGKKSNSSRNTQPSTFFSPPAKVKWTIASSSGNKWNPYIGGTLIPESVMQQWTKKFMLTINEGHFNGLNFMC